MRVQGTASVARLASALGALENEAAQRARELVDEGLAERSTGPIKGWSLTSAGHDALDSALEAEGMRGDPVLTDHYSEFLESNKLVLQAATDWQVRRYGGAEIANDHTDPEYDQSVIFALRQVHERASGSLGALARRLARLEPYLARLQSCLERLESGDMHAFTGILEESYHTVWMELHQDLLLTLGLERAD